MAIKYGNTNPAKIRNGADPSNPKPVKVIKTGDDIVWSQPLKLGVAEVVGGTISVSVEPSTGNEDVWSILYPQWTAPQASGTFTPTEEQQRFLIAPVEAPLNYPAEIDITSASYPSDIAPFIWNIIYSAGESTANKIRITFTGCAGATRSAQQRAFGALYNATVEVSTSDLFGATSYADRIVLIPGNSNLGSLEFYYEGTGDWRYYHFIQHKASALSLNWYIQQVESLMSSTSPFPKLSEPNAEEAAGSRTSLTNVNSTLVSAQAYYGDLVTVNYNPQSDVGYDYTFQYCTAQCYQDSTAVGTAWTVTNSDKWQLNKLPTQDYNWIKFKLNYNRTDHQTYITVRDSYNTEDPGVVALGAASYTYGLYGPTNESIDWDERVNYTVSKQIGYHTNLGRGFIKIWDDYFEPEGFTRVAYLSSQGINCFASKYYINRLSNLTLNVNSYTYTDKLFDIDVSKSSYAPTSGVLTPISLGTYTAKETDSVVIFTKFEFTDNATGKRWVLDTNRYLCIPYPFSTSYGNATEYEEYSDIPAEGYDDWGESNPGRMTLYRRSNSEVRLFFPRYSVNGDNITLVLTFSTMKVSNRYYYQLYIDSVGGSSTYSLSNVVLKGHWGKLEPCVEI